MAQTPSTALMMLLVLMPVLKFDNLISVIGRRAMIGLVLFHRPRHGQINRLYQTGSLPVRK